MNEKHLRARIDQCLRNAELSRCPRRKFGAMIVDPHTNSIISDGYNGPPRGEEGLCEGDHCVREGLVPADFTIEPYPGTAGMYKTQNSKNCQNFAGTRAECRAWIDRMCEAHPPIASGTRMELGCHHAEANVLGNALRRGASVLGAWLIVTGEPCMMCAKFIHHAGIAKVFVVQGGYAGGIAGVEYLKRYLVEVEYVDGPADPRTAS